MWDWEAVHELILVRQTSRLAASSVRRESTFATPQAQTPASLTATASEACTRWPGSSPDRPWSARPAPGPRSHRRHGANVTGRIAASCRPGQPHARPEEAVVALYKPDSCCCRPVYVAARDCPLACGNCSLLMKINFVQVEISCRNMDATMGKGSGSHPEGLTAAHLFPCAPAPAAASLVPCASPAGGLACVLFAFAGYFLVKIHRMKASSRGWRLVGENCSEKRQQATEGSSVVCWRAIVAERPR